MALILDNPKLIFVHIPKTGGMSIRHSLMSVWGMDIYECGATHNGLTNIISILGQGKFNQYYSFAVVRNPYDWAVSLYHFATSSQEHPDHQKVKDMPFNEFCVFLCRAVSDYREIATGKYSLQCEYIMDGENKVTDILRFENLDLEYKRLCDTQLINKRLKLRKINESVGRKPFQEYFTDPTIRNHFENVFHKDFDLFNYPLIPSGNM